MVKLLSLCLLGMLASACATPEEIEMARQLQEQTDIRNCVELGFEPNTPAFADCRLRLIEMRSRERTARMNQVHFGYGAGWRGRHWVH